MTFTDWESYEWTTLERQHAVELFAKQISYSELENAETITLPIRAAKVILASARDGQHKGQGRRRPRDSDMDRIAKRTVIQWARDRKAQLVKEGARPGAAEEQAATEARDEFGKRTGLSEDYIKRMMQSTV
jgi:hypothetical protein